MTTFGFIVKSMFRRKLLVTLSMLSLTTAFLLFIFLRSVAVLFSGALVEVADTRMQTTSKVSMIMNLPFRYGDLIRSVDGVVHVTYATWFGGTFEEGDTSDFTFAVEPESYFAVYDNFEIDPQQFEDFVETRTGAVAHEDMVNKHGWEIGQKIPVVSPIYPTTDGEPWIFDLVGTYKAEGEFFPFLFHYEYFKEATNVADVGWYNFTIDDPTRSAEIARIVDQQFENSADATKTMTESQAFRDFFSQYGDISLMMNGIISAVFFTMLLLTANTLIHSYRQRIPELAVLKTLGFSDGQVSRFMLFEGLFFSVCSALIGIGIAVLLLTVAGPYMPQGFVLVLTPNTLLLGAAIAGALGLLIGFVPAYGANRLNIVNALHAR